MVRRVMMPPKKVAPVKARTAVSSGLRGQPIADLVEKIEARNPALVAASGLTSAGMRAGAMVRGMRRQRGFSQTQLATKMGVTQEWISEIERGVGEKGPTFETLERVAHVCGMTITAVDLNDKLAMAGAAGLLAQATEKMAR